MSQTRKRFSATYSYPGSFFAETESRDLASGTLESAIAEQPNSNWYAVAVKSINERKFVAANGTEKWLAEGNPEKIGSWIVGEKIHWEDIPDTDENRILRSNIRVNSKDGYGVKTRLGNWQIASDYTAVI